MSGQRLGYYEGPDNYELDPHTEQSVTAAVVNLGVGFQQTLESVAPVRFAQKISLLTTEASSAAALQAGLARITVPQAINYIILSTTARGNTLLCSVNGDIENIQIGAVFFQMADFVQSAGTTIYRIPTQRNYNIVFLGVPPAGWAAPYQDYARVVFGYIPDETERVLVGSGE